MVTVVHDIFMALADLGPPADLHTVEKGLNFGSCSAIAGKKCYTDQPLKEVTESPS